MRVSIFTEDNNRLGLGHIIHDIILYQAFEERGVLAKRIADYILNKKFRNTRPR